MSQSVIRIFDLNENRNAYKTASKDYYMVYLVNARGDFVPCLLTEDAVAKGLARAVTNPEDVCKLSLLQRLVHSFLTFIGR